MNKIQRKLYDYCCCNSSEQLQATLDNKISNESIDITFDGGQLFGIAIANDMPKVLSILLNYYEKTNLQCDLESSKYKLAKGAIVNILQNEVDSSCVISEEIWKILHTYDIKDPERVGELESEQDLEGFDGISDDIVEDLLPEFNTLNAASEYDSPFVDTPKELIGAA